MSYFVIHPNGQKYGPADVPTLNQWILENRLSPSTELESAVNGQRVMASSVPGLNFGMVSPTQMVTPGFQPPTGVQNPYDTMNPGQQQNFVNPPNPYAQAPTPQHYHTQPVTSNGQTEAVIGWIFAGIGTICCFSFCGILFNIVGLILGYSAKQKGNSQGTAIMILSGVMLGISVLLTILGVASSVFNRF